MQILFTFLIMIMYFLKVKMLNLTGFCSVYQKIAISIKKWYGQWDPIREESYVHLYSFDKSKTNYFTAVFSKSVRSQFSKIV